MRFSTAWVKVAAQNVTLKVATVTLAGVAVCELVVLAQLALRDPLVIERQCFSKLIPAKAVTATADEIESFLMEALPMRFDTSAAVKAGFLTIEETTLREREQAALKQRQMAQKIIIAGVLVDGSNITVTADRLISIGKIKTVLPLDLKVTVQYTTRTESNPYGLILSNSSEIATKEGK